MEQLLKLAKPFPDHFIENVQGKDYVNHALVNQKILAVLGPFSYSIDEIIYSAEGKVEACLATMTVTIDGRKVSVQECGDAENAGAKGKNGTLLQTASSSAFKKCAMRFGVGLHLWSKGEYHLEEWINKIWNFESESTAEMTIVVDEESEGEIAVEESAEETPISEEEQLSSKEEEPEEDKTQEVVEALKETLGAEEIEDPWTRFRQLFEVIEDKDQKSQIKKDFKNRYEMEFGYPLKPHFGDNEGEADWCIEQATLLIEMHNSVQESENSTKAEADALAEG